MTAVIDVTESPVFGLGIPDPDRIMEPTGVASDLTVGTPSVSLVMSPVGITGGITLGDVSLVVSVHPDGVAGTGDLGSAQVDAEVTFAGLPSTVTFGHPDVFTSMNPSGFDAAGGGAGDPATTAVINPAGIASTTAIGDVETLATVFIIPGPVDPSNDFGNATAIKKGWVFRPSINTYQWRLFKEYEGISLLKESGTWTEVAHPDLERTLAAEKYLGGGRDHVVSTGLKAELEGLGYTVSEEIVTTERYET
jgi:hypothetical protein